MPKYSKEFKLKIIQSYLSGNAGLTRVAAAFNVDRKQLREWLSAYEVRGADALETKQSQQQYSAEFKLAVIAHRLKLKLSLPQTAAIFNIPSSSTIYVWERRYNQYGINAFADRCGHPTKMKNPEDLDQSIMPNESLSQQIHATLLCEIEYLKSENAYLKKLDALIWKKRLQQRTRPKSSQD